VAAERSRTGTVTSFDDDRGLGEVTDTEGTVWPFHCTAIADGTRTIDEGVEVSFGIRPGPMGRWEASGVHPS
jgi:cold shock CspA family protein